MTLYFDTETSGKADFKASPLALHQPRIVQLGAVLEDNDGKEVSSINLIATPDGFEIPEEASAIHGITQMQAVLFGISIRRMMLLFKEFWAMADRVVAHNIDFDLFMLDIEFSRLGMPKYGDPKDIFCTMKLMTPICKLPKTYKSRDPDDPYKWPNMQEAHLHATGANFDGGHDAMADVRACGRVFRWLIEQGKIL